MAVKEVLVIASMLVITSLLQGINGFSVANETALRTYLFTTNAYDLNVRPTTVVKLEVRFNLLTINQMDIREQVFKVSGWLTVQWYDSRLSWDQTTYGDVGVIFALDTEVWRPALIVSNSVDNFEIIQDEYSPLRIANSGRVVWDPPGIYEVNCEADISYYPFDTQECFITLQSWGYNLRELNITELGKGINTGLYVPNGEWDLVDNYFTIVQRRDIKNDDYSQIIFHFNLKRRSEYYWLNILLPVIVNSILTALVFALPAESGEKMGYSLTVLLSFMVLLTLVADKIPSTSIKTSIIVVYFSFVLILGAMSVFLSTVVLDLYFRDENHRIPAWLMFLSKNIVGRLVCYKGCKRRSKVTAIQSDTNGNVSGLRQGLRNKVYERKTDYKRNTSQEDDDVEEETYTWKDISKILDTFFLWFYLVIITVITIGFLTVVAT
ncbi:hypothetical protein SNE40_023381 [Patella caerulea]|uniref:Uncharacterized protein n=1 Tax=Patella caerulea TaxID=87958 RepID=A0AAN8IWY3_PATCE